MKAPKLRKALKWLGGLAVGCLLLLAVGKVYLDAVYFRGYDASAPLKLKITETKPTPDYLWTKFYYAGFRDDRVPAVLTLPVGKPGPFPCVIFVHGIGDNKDSMRRHGLDEPFIKAGFAFACFDQLMRGERKLKDESKWAQAEAFRVRAAYTVGDIRRLLDYLVTRPDIATNRIYLCGASYGAITGSTAAAFDERIRAVDLIYGGGNLWRLLSAEAADELGRWRLPAYLAGWYFGSVFDPVNYIGRISPRPLLLQNGRADTVVAPSAAKALQAAARAPKQIIWYDGNHPGLNGNRDPDIVLHVLTDALAFLQGEDAKIRSGTLTAHRQ